MSGCCCSCSGGCFEAASGERQKVFKLGGGCILLLSQAMSNDLSFLLSLFAVVFDSRGKRGKRRTHTFFVSLEHGQRHVGARAHCHLQQANQNEKDEEYLKSRDAF